MIGHRLGRWAALAGVLLLAAVPRLRAQEVTSLFPARPAGHLTDVARVVPADAAQRIEALARDLRTRTGAELAIVTLPAIGDRAPEEVALAILRTWGVGAKAEIGDQTRNAGLVVLVVPKPADGSGRGRLRIEVGNGLEGIVPDLQAARVRDAMRPQLAAGDYGGGLLTGVQALDQLITRGMDPRAPKSKAGSRKRVNIVPVIIVGFVLLMILSGAMGGAAARSSGVRYGGRSVSRRRGPFDGGPYIGGGWGGGSGWGGGGDGGGFTFGGGGGGSGGGAGGDF